jgi:hypothetical protein
VLFSLPVPIGDGDAARAAIAAVGRLGRVADVSMDNVLRLLAGGADAGVADRHRRRLSSPRASCDSFFVNAAAGTIQLARGEHGFVLGGRLRL